MEIRDVRREDLDELMILERWSFTDPWTREMFEDSLDLDSYIFKCMRDDDGALLAYAIVMCAADQADVASIAVDPEKRRMGYGRKMLEYMLGEAAKRGVNEVFLEVRESNIAARSLYDSFGFEVLTVRRRYYKNPSEDALLMGKRL